MPFRLKDFAFFYSLQVGVVVFSVLGMVVHTVALLKYLTSSVTETSPKNTVYQYTISLVFIALGLAIYILGLTGSALEESKIVRVGGSLLVVEFVYWIILMGISFSGVCLLTRRVCVDNRCPERLYVQNGYWRPTVYDCNATDNDTIHQPEHVRNGGDVLFVDLTQNVTDGVNACVVCIYDVIYDANNIEKELEGRGNFTVVDELNGSTPQYDNITIAREDNSTANADYEDVGNHTWSPIGDLRTYPHFALSVASTVLIIFFWYLYPIWLFFSFATQLDYDER